MDHNLTIVIILGVGLSLASLFAFIAQRLKLPTILAYLLAGYIIGPYSPGFVADVAIADQLAEVGVILMLFGVGLHFKLEDLNSVKSIALPGAIVQMVVATLASIYMVSYIGWPVEVGLIIGLAISVASTVVVVRVLSDNGIVNTPQGRIAIGWLVVEDIFTVIILILLPILAELLGGATYSLMSILSSVVLILVKFAVLVLFMFTWGHKIVECILTNMARLRSHELFTLTVLAMVFLIALGSSLIFGTSLALGAFIAGMVIGNTNVKHQAAANSLPLKDIFAIIFFISIGMIFNPAAIVDNIPLFLAMLAVILIVKPLIALLVALLLKCSFKVAMTVGLLLAQIGEFSFILAAQAMFLKILPEQAFDILVACALISITLNPLLFQILGPLEAKVQKIAFSSAFKANLLRRNSERSDHHSKVVIVGLGVIGEELMKEVKKLGYFPIVVEYNIDTVSHRKGEDQVIFGDASQMDILENAQLAEASHLLITISNIDKTIEIIQAAQHVNPMIQILVNVEYMKDREILNKLKILYVCAENENVKAFTAMARRMLNPGRHQFSTS